MTQEYDVIVVGAGHAGCEAAAAAANLGSKVLLITMNMNTIAQMSCNPAMGGVAKGQIVREVDALGGQSGIITDKTMIQFRMLNRSKGPAMWSPRAQSDRMRFAEEWRLTLEGIANVDFWQEAVTGLLVEGDVCVGVRTQLGIEFRSKTVVLTNGTFLNGLIHIGEKNFGGGRAAESKSTGITEQLRDLGFETGRMKTGTPPRVDGRTLDYARMEEQPGDEEPSKFSYLDTPRLAKQRPCYITYTNEKVHDILRTGFEKSPMFQGRIKGLGPRYCPSVEDKINRFADKDRHQIFVEPEGWSTVEVYVNGFSSSLPEDVQYNALRQIAGFENAKMFRPGYAIEYDFFPPTQLHLTLETKPVRNLYFAGQINGTTGYEEAACQGLMAGINAHLRVREQEPFVLRRSEAYIGVLIDDLVNKGTDEPYRMFTSRAEHRILLRQDNADLRLTPLAHKLGLASDERLQRVEQKRQQTADVLEYLNKKAVEPGEINGLLVELGSAPISEKTRAVNLLRRPQIELTDLQRALPELSQYLGTYGAEALEQASIHVKYETYIEKENQQAKRMGELEDVRIVGRLDYKQMPALSHEAREKLLRIQPETIGQASRISGISPADISVLMVYLGK
ncbi:tRNA uridine-5-carboxymethylaminomethyl(34) synthesis enzyme MnmG [Solirubrum puertoriconensis]|uniref:tRNA uridine 5-carboxymethylaminomethyl modification enzyme MnmG n=1 Tax=Solirubrum puertoriconensis TaxID=1751427 RepID=A0A9X0L3Z5_SOLP1|nr:tRNA uridine-5-carboxymethylaminomethyl(34) synthesis enzyme MnmG [Solirubrum puertoriconensis]KUG07041.1 tRNA uridine 5-carboxymethylaminomethyl modification protein [Solirubrum puertoriconensis]